MENLAKLKKKKLFPLFCCFISILAYSQQKIHFNGKILSDTELPLTGVTVTITNPAGEKLSVKSDKKGVFNFDNLISGVNYNITVSQPGYEMYVKNDYFLAEGVSENFIIQLEPKTKTINEIVMVGYGSQKKGNISTSITTLKMSDVDPGATQNAVKMLQGRASGVNIITPGGSPGTSPIVLVRGVGSISGGSQPLYVVDGIPNETFPNISPGDVESMEVLKDAAAASIYGSRANSGVVIITTKSGKKGKTQINANFKTGWGTIYNDIKMANSMEYQKVMNAAINNYNAQKGTNLTLYVPSVIEETDWVKAISRSVAMNQSYDINMSGGTDNSKFYTSIGYLGQEGILKTTKFEQYNLRLKFNQEISKYFKLNLNISGTVTPQQLVEENSTSLKNLRNAREEQPWYSPYLSDGTYKINGTYILRHNPVMMYNEEKWTRTKYEGLGSISLDITPFKGFKYTPSVNVYANFIDEKKKLTDQMHARRFTAGWGALLRDRNTALRFVIDNVLSYSGKIKDLNYTAMIGHSYEKFNTDLFGAFSSNYANNAYPSPNLDIINAGPAIFPDPLSNDFQSFNLESLFGRVSLDYNGKYIVNASVRRDGSSRFSKSNRYGIFPSVSFAWRVSKESFLNENNTINDLKLRLSYGSTGSMAGIGNFASQSLVSAGNGYNNQGSLVLLQDAQNLTWEKANQFDAGFDAEFFKGKINFTFDYYYQLTKDLLYNRPIYSTSGYTSIPSNIGSLANQGLEFGLGSKIFNGDFKWNFNTNISFIKNKLVSLYNNADMYIIPSSGLNQVGGQMHALINGKPISAFYLLNMTGIYQYDKDVPTKLFAKGVRAGDVIYEDINGDGDITDADRKYVGKAIPDYYGGITNNFSWKNFDLGIFCQYSVGNKIMASWRGVNSEGTEHLGDAMSNVNVGGSGTVAQFFNISKSVANSYWDGPGTSNTTPRPIRNGAFSGYTFNYNLLPSTRQLEDGSFFKVKTVTLGYQLPQELYKNANISSIRLFLSVDNFLTFTKYSGYDPEQSFASNPGDANYGVDFGLQAALRTYIIGLNIKF